jgi:hypothetical protein
MPEKSLSILIASFVSQIWVLKLKFPRVFIFLRHEEKILCYDLAKLLYGKADNINYVF